MVAVALVVAACQAASSPAPQATASPNPTTPTHAATSTLSATPAATPVAAGAALVTEKTAVSEVSIHGTGQPTWDVVALGDSNVAGWAARPDEAYTPSAAFPGVYSDLLAAEQGVTIALHSYFPDQMGNEIRTVAQWADVLAADEQMRANLRRAKRVIVLVGYHDVIPILLLGACGSTWPDPLRGCLKQATDAMPAAFDRLYGDIGGHFRLRYDTTDGKGAITLRRGGRLHHLKVGAAHARARALAIVGEEEVTVAARETGQILSVHRIDPRTGHWRNQRRDPGRWPGSREIG